MALSERDIDALTERILHGAQERYVAELTESVQQNLAELARRGWTTAALEQLALMVPATAAQLLVKHQDAVGDEVAAEVSAALEASSASDDSVLMAVYGAQAAAKAASWFPTGASSHFREIALQTARGLADIIRRQNVILSESAALRWYEVAGEAVTAANLGLKPYDQLLAEATVKLADAGIAVVEYGHGGARTAANMVDVAVRRHIVTQVSQASGRMAIDRMRAYDHRLVVTSAHYGARPSHAEWQGLPCAIDGEAIVEGVRYPDIVELTGYGTVGGLKGANCRHSINPYFPGITELPAREWPEHEEEFGCSSEAYYEATQRQRELERRIRKTKREIAALEGNGFGLEDPTYVQKRLLLGNQQKALGHWCDERNLVRQYAREKAYGVTAQPRALKTRRNKTSGALTSKNDPTGMRREAHAISYYEQLRRRGADSLVDSLVANNITDAGTAERAIKHLLFEEHDLASGHERFFPDYNIAQSLQRLLDGRNVQVHDKLLLPHESLEAVYMSKGMGYDEAHSQANLKYNFSLALRKWLFENELR